MFIVNLSFQLYFKINDFLKRIEMILSFINMRNLVNLKLIEKKTKYVLL